MSLEIYEVPGHTPGSVAVLIREERTLLLGDACNPFTFLFEDKSLSVEEYREVLLRLNHLTKGCYDKVYLSHGYYEASKDMIESVIAVCDDILNGTVDNVPMKFMGMDAYIAKAVREDKSRVDGGLANVIYNKDKIYKIN